jgi:cation diffusion facilitator CzcD-associated flavoprotein CzcO
MGNSAMDIACELSKIAASTRVSARRGAWILPKYILGKPLDQGQAFPRRIPPKMRRMLVTASFQALYGKMSQYGLPNPDHLIGEAHPTVSSHFPALVKSGAIEMRPGFQFGSGNKVTYSDGVEEAVTAIVFCTGYHVTFPFFDAAHVSAPDNTLPLYHRAFHLEHRRVFFVGLAQTIGAIIPVAEAQSRAIAAHLCGDYNLPPTSLMKAHVERDERQIKARFVASPRHTMQIVPEVFLPRLQRDLELGILRARSHEGIAFHEDSVTQ